MLITFKTDVYADISMFENDALSMLRMMGLSETVPGAILAADVPQALHLLTSALNAQKEISQPVENKDGDTEEPVVSMRNRGLPLIELLTAAVKKRCNVMWE